MTHKIEKEIIRDQKVTIKRLQEELKQKSDFCFMLMEFIMTELRPIKLSNHPFEIKVEETQNEVGCE